MAKIARADMFLDLADDPREIRPPMTDERSTLVGYLRDQRYTLEIKCSGLDADGMAARSVPPSTMSLLGLVRHLADTERGWFRNYMAGEDVPARYSSREDPDGEWDNATADPAVVEEAWAAWREECAWTDAFVAAAPDLELPGSHPSDMHTNLRQVLIHLIEEYARHNGHADLLREALDGTTGR
jgi:uncharacterized damage-inducible protein DinB